MALVLQGNVEEPPTALGERESFARWALVHELIELIDEARAALVEGNHAPAKAAFRNASDRSGTMARPSPHDGSHRSL